MREHLNIDETRLAGVYSAESFWPLLRRQAEACPTIAGLPTGAA